MDLRYWCSVFLSKTILYAVYCLATCVFCTSDENAFYSVNSKAAVPVSAPRLQDQQMYHTVHTQSDSHRDPCSGVGKQCKQLNAECLLCDYNVSCIYGEVDTTTCVVMKTENPCTGEKKFKQPFKCRYCYQTEPWEHICTGIAECNARAAPPQVYRANCTVHGNVFCKGHRSFFKNLPCKWTSGTRWSTALLLSITLGGFGADRFYLGHWQEGIGKLFSFGGLGVWTLIDVVLIATRYLGPADGSLYVW